MTGPFVRVQETKLYGPTWVKVTRIVKFQASSNGTTIFLDGAGSIQIEEVAETLIDRLGAALAERVVPRAPVRSGNGTRRGKTRLAEAHDA